MIGTRFPIEIPPGIISNGAERDNAGRWIDGAGVRFVGREGAPQPIGENVNITTQGATITGTPRFIYAYQDPNGGATRVVVMTSTSAFTFLWPDSVPTVRDMVPTGYVATAVSTYSAASFDSTLLFTNAGHAAGPLWFQTAFTDAGNKSNNFFTVYGDSARGVFITPQQFVVVLTNTDNQVVWASQGGFSTWAPSGTNSAGALSVPTSGRIWVGHVVNGEILLFGDKDLWELEYVGGDLIYGLRQKSEACGLIGPNCAVPLSNSVIWMGQNGFFEYDGFVRELPCDLAHYIFSDINSSITVPDKFFARRKTQFNEVWFHYASAGSTVPNRAVIYNYENQTWTKAPASAASALAGTHDDIVASFLSSNFPTALDVDASAHVQVSDKRSTFAADAFLQSGDLLLPNDRMMRVQRFLPDSPSLTDQYTITRRASEGFPAGTTGALSEDVSGDRVIDVNLLGRYFRLRQDFQQISSTVGKPQLVYIPSSPR